MSDIHALSGAYAVDGLDDVERTSFERHLAGCPTCRDEVDGLREASSLLADTSLAQAPDSLRARVLAEIATTRPLPPLAPVVSLAERRRGPRRSLAALVAAAAAVLAIGGGTIVVQQLGDEPAATPQLSATDRVMRAADAESFTTPAKGGGTVTVVRSSSLNQAVLMTQGLADAPSGHTLEMWLQHDTKYIPAGFLANGADHKILLDGDPGSAQGFGLTVEPSSGSTEPSDDLVALLKFTSA